MKETPDFIQPTEYEARLERTYSKIVTPNIALRQVQKWQEEGKKVVITDVVCDLYHRAHSEYFLAAELLGDKLLVRVDTDEHVAEKKDPKGPLIDYENRVKTLAHIPYINLLTSKSNGTLDWIKFYKPDVLIKSTTSGEKLIKEIDEISIILAENNITCEIIVFDEYCKQVAKPQWLDKAIDYEKNKLSAGNNSGSMIKHKFATRLQEKWVGQGYLQSDLTFEK